jgi:chemotaxis protein MotB
MKAMKQLSDFEKLKNQIEMTITPEGLKIELMESPNGTFFENGKAKPTPALENLLKILSIEVGKLPNPVSIEGHTDSKPFSGFQTYGNWELSTDRANAARRAMEDSGLRPNQVVQVRGYADQELRYPQHPQAASNRRVTLLIQYPKPESRASFTSNGTLPSATDLSPAPAPAAKVPAAPVKDAKPEK